MKIQSSNTITLEVTEVEGLYDPLKIYLEDFGSNKGELIVKQCGKAWSARWNAMGGSLIDFIADGDWEYLLNNLAPHIYPLVDDKEAALDRHMKGLIVLARRRNYIDGALARNLWSVTDWHHYYTPNPEIVFHCPDCVLDYQWEECVDSGLLDLFEMPQKENPYYAEMRLRVKAVIAAVQQYRKESSGESATG